MLAAVDPLRLRLEVPELESTAIQPGQPLRIMVGRSTNTYSAKISRVSPVLNATSRMLVVEADVPSAPALRLASSPRRKSWSARMSLPSAYPWRR